MKKQVLGIMALCMLVGAQSCVKNNVETSKDTPNKVQELIVPQNFDWVMSKTITCNVNSTTPAKIEIYSDKECIEELLAAFITGESSNSTFLSVPKSTEKLYLKYISVAGTVKIVEQNINNNVVTFSVSDAGAVKSLQTKVATKDVPVDKDRAYMSYPSGWGTVMFEDLFPNIGDYDFNDFVASYLITVEYPWKNGKYDTRYAKNIRVHLRLRAIGGSIAYTPYVGIVGLKKANVTIYDKPYNSPTYPDVNPKISNNTTDGVKVSLVDNIANDAVVEFKNLNASNPNRIAGGMFYNTNPGFITKESSLTFVCVWLALNEEVLVKDLLDDKIDIFLASPDKKKEIHLRGFNSVFSSYDFSVAGVNKKVPYASDKNLVWGIKVPKGISHAAEMVNFCNAYKDFANWAMSGGEANVNWYTKNMVKDSLIVWPK